MQWIASSSASWLARYLSNRSTPIWVASGAVDAHKIAVDSLKGAFKIFLKDLEAIPEDAYDKSFGPKCRTVADIVYEVNMVNDHVGMVIRGEKAFEWPDEGWIKAPEDFRKKDVVIKAFQDSSAKQVATAEGLTQAQMEEPFKTGERETTRFERFRFMTLHTWYHSGQLNFIQTLLGDDAWHW